MLRWTDKSLHEPRELGHPKPVSARPPLSQPGLGHSGLVVISVYFLADPLDWSTGYLA